MTKCEWPTCKERIKKQGLKNVNELLAWFTNQMAEYIDSRGRRLISWSEALNVVLIKPAIVMPWNDISQGSKGAESSHLIINSLDYHTYVNYQQFPTSRDIYECNGGWWRNFLPFYSAYSNDPYLGIRNQLRDQVLGL